MWSDFGGGGGGKLLFFNNLLGGGGGGGGGGRFLLLLGRGGLVEFGLELLGVWVFIYWILGVGVICVV